MGTTTTTTTRTAAVTQHNLTCECGVNVSLMRGAVRAACSQCSVIYLLPELTCGLRAEIQSAGPAAEPIR